MVSRRLAADKAPELAGLDFQHAAVGHFILELRVGDLGVEAPEPSLPESLAPAVVEEVVAEAEPVVVQEAETAAE